MIKTSSMRWSANALFTIESREPIPGSPQWANLLIRRNPIAADDFRGPGIYAGFFDGMLIYIGKFLGQKKAPFRGNILSTRWDKHIGSMTLRSRSLSFSKRSLNRILRLPQPYGEPVISIHSASEDTLLRDRGTLSTYNRFRFAMRHWSDFSQHDTLPLARFSFLYVRVLPIPDAETLAISDLRNFVTIAENLLVDELKPYCNACIADGVYPSQYDLEKVQRTIERTIDNVFRGESQHPLDAPMTSNRKLAKPPGKQHRSAAAIREIEMTEPLSAQELFLERLEDAPAAAQKLVGLLIKTFEGGNGIEVHFKRRSPADLRIRYTRPGVQPSKGRNVFTMQWQPRKNAFLCNAYSEPAVCNRLGAKDAKRTHDGEPLRTAFKLEPEYDATLLLAIVRHSIDDFKG